MTRLLVLLLCVGSTVYAQTPFWAYTVPSTPRKLYVHGRELFGAFEGDSRSPQARLANGNSLKFDRDVLVDELNRALHEVLIFEVPDDLVPDGVQPIEVTRVDGKKFKVDARIGPKANPDPPRMGGVVDLTGEYEFLSAPKVVMDLDGEGKTFLPANDFKGRSLIVCKGGTIKNCRLFVPESATNPTVALEVNTDRPVYVSNIEIENRRVGGYGLCLTKCFESTFSNMHVIAARPYHADPIDKHGRNVFYRCAAQADRPGTGICGRAFLSEENCVVECSWSNLDRGPIGQQSGPPLYRTLLYRCHQSNTGTTVGGSEGVLWESIVTSTPTAKIEGNKVSYTLGAGETVDAGIGRAVMLLDGSKLYARITASAPGSLTVDKDLGQRTCPVSIGNPIIENTVANCTFTSGKNAVYFFGRSIGNAIVGGEAREISDVVVIHEKDADGLLAFDWRNYRRWFRVNQSCGRELYRPTMYYDPSKPYTQLPWLRLVP